MTDPLDNPIEEDELHSDLKELLEALKDNKNAVSHEIVQLARKIDQIPAQLEAIRKETRDSLDSLRKEFRTDQANLRRDLENMFLSKNEYMPKHDILIERINKQELTQERMQQQFDGLDSRFTEHRIQAEGKFNEYDRAMADGRQSLGIWHQMQEDVRALKQERAEKRSGRETMWVALYTIVFIITVLGGLVFFALQHVTLHP